MGVCCLVYLDDIIIYSDNSSEHVNHVRLVTERLRFNNLKVKMSKCRFAHTSVEYLSHIIRDGTMTTNPSKTEAVSGYVRPKTVKQLQSFLGLVSYYRKFIKGCASICSPLITLTKKGVEFVWTDDCESAFESLKEKLTSENNVLVIPSEGEQIRVEADKYK